MAIKVRDFEVRLTRNKEERKQVRQLRYNVFCLEENASATEEQKSLGEEYDAYDTYADYMAVFHNNKIVGTYRIIDRVAAEKMGGFYTEHEFNLSKIKKVKGNIAEMSRACVNAEYRENGLVMSLLWAGLCEYVVKRKVSILFGVPSFVGTNPAKSAQALSYLYYNCLSPSHLLATVLKENLDPSINPQMTQMNILPRAFVDEAEARKQMTPLIKGYLRLGATFGRGVFIDKGFGTYDVFVLVQTKNIDKTYQKDFTGSENAFDDLDVKMGPLSMLGKIIMSPFTGTAKALRAFAELFMREDAADVEYIDKDEEESNGDNEQ
ncbi:MAG: GNAT family N-acetyltransferase [Alphaproteobacteria bacterium]|nr:GNAT family N-acetyltransferase [Alphaproteobacteria bacterium]